MVKKLNLQFFTSTKATDVIIPAVWGQYVYETTKELSKLMSTGIAMQSDVIDELASSGGLTFNVPFFNDLSGDDEVMDDTTASVPSKITAGSQIGARLLRTKSWERSDLSNILAGADPLGEFMMRVAIYWDRAEQKIALSIFKGLFSAETGSVGPLSATHVLDISSGTGDEAKISANAILDAKQLLGDADSGLTILCMHSATRTALQKQNLIQTVVNSEGKILFERYLEYKVAYFDSMPKDGDVYTTYIMGDGILGRGEGTPDGLIPFEADRDTLASSKIFMSRRSLVLHPYGLKWVGTPAKQTPSNSELEVGSNWAKVLEDKAIKIVALKHKI